MTDIAALLPWLIPYLSNTTMRQMKYIVLALLCIPDRVALLNMARRAEGGGSYRTIQRWYHTPLDWAALLWSIVRIPLLEPHGAYLLAGDEGVISKASQRTHGRGRFYPSLAQRPINSVSFIAVWLIDVQARQAYPLQVAQRQPAVLTDPPVDPAPKRPHGRPKGN